MRASIRRCSLMLLVAAAPALAGCPSTDGDARKQPSPALDRSAPPRSPLTSGSAVPAQPAPTPDAGALGIHLPNRARGRAPFVLWLHGFGASGAGLVKALHVGELAADHHFAWAAPDGALDSRQRRYWNASPACCNLDHTQIDHVAELGRLISAARAQPSIDPGRVYVIGYSNGGFMAHRLACELPGITGVASLAGAAPTEACKPTHPVAILEVHGDADEVVRYNGGRALDLALLAPHPSARDTIAGWARRNHCKSGPASGAALDLDDKLEGSETVVSSHSGCDASVELWTVRGAGHFVVMNRRALDRVLGFLEKQVTR